MNSRDITELAQEIVHTLRFPDLAWPPPSDPQVLAVERVLRQRIPVDRPATDAGELG